MYICIHIIYVENHTYTYTNTVETHEDNYSPAKFPFNMKQVLGCSWFHVHRVVVYILNYFDKKHADLMMRTVTYVTVTVTTILPE